MVSRLVNQSIKNPDLIHELVEKCHEEQRKRDKIAEYIFNLNIENHFIDSAEEV